MEEPTEKEIKEATNKLVKKAEIENSISGRFIFDKENVVNPTIFSCHKIEDSFCYGFLLPKEIPIYSGKGDKRKYVGKEQIRSPAVINSEGKLIEPSIATENKYKIKYIAIPTELDLRISLKAIDNFRRREYQKPEGIQIFNSIKNNYEKFLFFHNSVWYDVHSLWDIGTYFFELFNTYPIMELRGLSGTAKSKVMKVSKLFTLNPTSIMINPSEASLFRITHSKRPTKYIDEAEKLFMITPSGQFISSPIVELINGSYSKGSSVPRLEKFGLTYKNVEYGCYSPCMIGSIAGLRDATESRAITHIMTKALDKDKRGELEIEDYERLEEFQNIRDNLYIFAWENWQKIENAYQNIKADNLKKRDFQLWKPLLAIAKIINEDVYTRVLEFAEKVSEQKRQDFIPESSLDYLILEAVKKELESGEKVYIKIISRAVNEKSSYKVAEKSISSHLDKIGFKEFRMKDMNGSYLFITKSSFEMIVSPICPSLSNYSSLSSYSSLSYIKDKKENDENEKDMTNNDEKESDSMTNMTQDDANDDTMTINDISTEKVEND